MASLCAKDSVIGKLRKWVLNIFFEETKPTEQHLVEPTLSVLAPDGFQSVCFNFERFVSEISFFELKSFYYALNEEKIALSDWPEPAGSGVVAGIGKRGRVDSVRGRYPHKEVWGKVRALGQTLRPRRA